MFLFSTLIIFITSSSFFTTLHGLQIPDPFCLAENRQPKLRYPPPSVRVPPNGNYQGIKFNDWTLPRAQNIYGTFFVSHTSRQSYLQLVNMRGEHYPIYPHSDEYPPGSEHSITSWSKCPDPNVNCTDPYAVATVFGYFKPVGAMGPSDKKPAAVWNFTSTGILAQTTNLYAILGFGFDTAGDGYLVQFETGYAAPGTDPKNAVPCINIVSRKDGGPSADTYRAIVAGLKDLGTKLKDDQFVQVVQQISPMKSDGRRAQAGPTECDDACAQNAGLVPQK